MEQIEILGSEIVPVLRKEMATNRPEHVPDAPTHTTLVEARGGAVASPSGISHDPYTGPRAEEGNAPITSLGGGAAS